MAAKEEMRNVDEAYPMTGGHGLHSYSNNSSSQHDIINTTKQLVKEAILENFNIPKYSPSNTIRVTDLGCSVGPNTFSAVQNILEAIEFKCQNQQIPEFQVFFNDHSANDFNTLFTSLPPNRRYHAAGVPGSFYSRLFPAASLHIVYSSSAIQWLSAVPKEVVDRTSPAWNKGRIYYSNAAEAVVDAYSAQYKKDMARFLQARAEEVVDGGLTILIAPGRPNGTPHSQLGSNVMLSMLGSCLMDMAKKGIVSEEKVNLFNIPVYVMSCQELEEAVRKNGCFSIERLEILPRSTAPLQSPSTRPKAQALSSHIRAGMEGAIKENFGGEPLDELFDSYAKKIEQEHSLIESAKSFLLFAALKRKTG